MTNKIVAWIKKQVKNAGAEGCVFGLSGGLDSSVVAALCKKALPDKVLGLLMPCYSSDQDLKDAKLVAKELAVPTMIVDLEDPFNQLFVQLEGKAYDHKQMNLAIANLKPRLRMVSLYYYANKLNYLVVGTGNKSEAVMGYCTKYGDAGVDILPLASLLKTEIRELAKKLYLPQEIIDKAPSAGLWPGQTDEAEMDITYADLDKIIIGIEKNKLKGLDPALIKKVKQKMVQNQHKRNMPPCY